MRFTAGLGNPGIISKLGVTVFFMSLMMLMLERKVLFLIFCVLSLIIVWLAGMRGDTYALIASTIFFILSIRYKVYLFSFPLIFILIIISFLILTNLDLLVLDNLLSQRLTKMWAYGLFQTEFFNSILNIFFGIGNIGTYFDSNYIYFLVSYGVIGFIILLIFLMIIYLGFHNGLSSKNSINKIFQNGVWPY